MRRIRRRYLEAVLAEGIRIPEDYLALEPAYERLERRCGRRPEPHVPCNNDLLAANFIEDGDRMWIIDYEYTGKNEPSFELGNLASENALDRSRDGGPRAAYWGSAMRQGRPGARLGDAGPLWLDAVGRRSRRRLRHRLRLLGVGDAEVRLGQGSRRRRFGREAHRPPGRRVTQTASELPDRARIVVIGGGVGGRPSPITSRSAARPTCSCSSARS